MLLLAVGCRELPAYFKGGAPLAKVGHRTLYLHEVERLAPAGIAGDDSAAFYRSRTAGLFVFIRRHPERNRSRCHSGRSRRRSRGIPTGIPA